ncbi:Ferric hydroxamate uptake [Leminorella grimontii]|uniref:TonB-dependent receptor plug domain-containing protein n=1 Tax=Leminorella grimontii TaxID=82981 RepID=UPI0010B4351F|nr:TonB-dependent receptor plug domain-containing protein [Leminorella grimontii]VFS57283.1 Ferric hydroxamate uptake [Leminorella grimontii]
MNKQVAPYSPTYKPLAYAVLLGLAAASPAMAEEKQQNAEAGETLIVTGTNTAMKIDTPAAETPRSVSEVTLEDIKDRGAKKIDEALRYSAGIQTGQYGADNRTDWLIIRGFEWAPYQNGLSTIYNEAGFYSWHQENLRHRAP